MSLAAAICLAFPISQTNRRYVVAHCISSQNCKIHFDPKTLPFRRVVIDDGTEEASTEPLILVIPLALTTTCLLVILVLVIFKICSDKNCLSYKRGDDGNSRRRRKRRASVGVVSSEATTQGDTNDKTSSAEVLFTESYFKGYDTV